MKRFLPYISILFVLILIGVMTPSHEALAGTCNMWPTGDFNLTDCVTSIFAEVVNKILLMVSAVLTLSGFLLNFSMNLTIHIKEFVESTPAIYTVWKSIRDISGMFIIFILLYAAIKMILSPFGSNTKMGDLIKTVVMAGILINFSFFITGLGIDVSNIVSVQLYNAIAPVNKLTGKSTEGAGLQAKLDGGISNIVMGALKIPAVFNITKTEAQGSQTNDSNLLSGPIKVIVAGIFGVLIIVSTALSFFLASLALIARFVILIMLLGFSPILFASFAIPQLDDYAKDWRKLYFGQLTFMPVYLLLMYFALSVLSSSNLFQTGLKDLVAGSSIPFANFIVLGINAAVVIIMLNTPLLAALSLGAKMPGWAKNVDGTAIWKKMGGYAGGFAGRNTIGRGAAALDKKVGNTWLGNKLISRDIRAATLGKAAAGKYGGSRSYTENKKAQREVENKQKEIDRQNIFNPLFKALPATPPPILSTSLDGAIKDMGEKEKLGLGAKALMRPEVLKNLKDSDFEAIKKDPEGNFTEQERTDIADARKALFKSAALNGDHETIKKMVENMKDDTKKSLASTRDEALRNAITSGDSKTIKNILSDMDGKELFKIQENNPTIKPITQIPVIEHLTPSQLRKLSDEGLAAGDKRILKTIITGWLASTGTAHKGVPTVNDPKWI